MIEVEAREGVSAGARPLGMGRPCQQLANLGDLEAKSTRVSDEAEGIHRSVVVAALVPAGHAAAGHLPYVLGVNATFAMETL